MELNELIKSIDIVEYISQYVDLEQRGDEWWGLSCFKDEKTPSFSVRKDPPFFYDYSSGIGGNLFTFVKEYHKCSKKEAVDIIKAYAGIDGEITDVDKPLTSTIICKKYQRKEPERKQSSGIILADDYMDRYEIDDEKLNVWRNEGISDESLQKFQVKYDGFSDRLVYPIRNLDGDIINVGGRTLDPQWKEKELRKYTYFFSWGTLNTIYGLAENMDSIKDSGEIILFEGCKSVLLADTWGIHNTGAILTSHLNPNQFDILLRLGCRVVFALDRDVQIRNDKNITRLKRYLNCYYLWDRDGLLDEKDSPVDKGKEVFGTLYAQRLRYR